MAIDIKKYVDISTTFPSANVAGRSFGGLVFTAAKTLPDVQQTKALINGVEYTVKSDLFDAWAAYNGGSVAFLTLNEVALLFGMYKPNSTDYTDEYQFAQNYYNYISPSGRYSSRLAFAKIGKVSANGKFADTIVTATEKIPDTDGLEKLTECRIATAADAIVETPLSAFNRANSNTNLFGSFTFLSCPGEDSSDSDPSPNDLSLTALKEVAAANAALDAKYLFVVNRTRGESTPSAVVDECKTFHNIKGTVFVSGMSDASAYMPMAILASTDYSNGQVVNFMFKQFANEEPTVEDDATYTVFNNAYVNFYGRAQTNGQTLDFYQRGLNTDGTDTAVYCNEMWFKAICETALMSLLVSRERLSADALGVDLVKLEVIDCCSSAISNGMFMRKDPTARDSRTIREIVASADGDAMDVESIVVDITTKGYSVYAYLSEMQDTDKLGRASEKIIIYYVFYGTADSVRYIKGNNVLLK